MANETIDLLGDGGILKTIITAGTGTRKPQNEDTVVVHYDGTLADGSFVDSSRKRNQKFSFIVGEGKVIQGWELGVPTMKLGEKALFTLQPEYAYGDTSPSENIPINSVVKFEIELFEWFQGENLAGKKNNKGVMYKDISKGGGYLKPKDGESAMISFKGVLDTDDGEVTVVDVKNKSVVVGAIATCTSILSIDDTDVKALFRRASALMEQGECKRAEYDLKNALLLQPTDTAIKRKLADCKKQIKLQEQKDRAVFAKMLG
ncbi:hypothetical protein SARC_02207 [Sphaeroforma arctica JP610]|uniref:peptidylprolyl isomerase n=1 Tax=Sphaeroforma arctica JP610 TaxID=667725 RepID=A0A0L0G9Q7_9EUKA|nr:hypothetical protein SARC_02207 [Sphaeroforma arctica JP610]KNC85634.1 hypothetical protein SARC_02207 [Sphaeroforma arctica JP610]|eukprot:XP_014159536.1 hypothetical protein SARC_02207 [Sphaeroforma arctica JP610]